MNWGTYVAVLKNGVHCSATYPSETLKEFLYDVQQSFYRSWPDIDIITIYYANCVYQAQGSQVQKIMMCETYELKEFFVFFPEKLGV